MWVVSVEHPPLTMMEAAGEEDAVCVASDLAGRRGVAWCLHDMCPGEVYAS